MNALEQWAWSHETSIEIAIAIHGECKGDLVKMQQLWDDPNDAFDHIVSEAWKIADDDEDEELFWGETLIERIVLR
jgi:hypothetical protein